MSGSHVYSVITSVGIGDGKTMPCAHMTFPIGSVAPPLPWCVYYLDEMEGFAADNRLHAKNYNWVVEHYWKDYDEDIEAALESAIESEFGAFRKTEVWVEDENCVQTAYYFAEIERTGSNDDPESE